jgi:hypothetical protein
MSMAVSTASSKRHGQASLTLGRYLDTLYHALLGRMSSPEWCVT